MIMIGMIMMIVNMLVFIMMTTPACATNMLNQTHDSDYDCNDVTRDNPDFATKQRMLCS